MVSLPMVPNCFYNDYWWDKRFLLWMKKALIKKWKETMISGNPEQFLLPVNGNNYLIIKAYTRWQYFWYLSSNEILLSSDQDKNIYIPTENHFSVGEVLLYLLKTISSIWLTSIAFTQKTPTAEALSVLLQFDHLSSSSDDITLQLMEKREKTYRKRVCKFCYRVSLRASSQLKGIW